MRAIDKNAETIQNAANIHFEEIKKRIISENSTLQNEIYASIISLKSIENNTDASYKDAIQKNDWRWLKKFILADVPTLRQMVQEDNLQFTYFRGLYGSYFASGSQKYLNKDSKYNAYALLKILKIKVCPYCDQHYIAVIPKENGKMARTSDLDHFFPKSEYPLLAMCFFNLLPVCKDCNYLKKEDLLGISPYEDDIEKQTYLFPDLPIGISVGSLTDDDCAVHIHPTRKMSENEKVLALESRYIERGDIVYELIKKGQLYDKTKLNELANNYPQLFENFEDVRRVLYGMELEVDGKRPFQKLHRDVLRTLGVYSGSNV